MITRFAMFILFTCSRREQMNGVNKRILNYEKI